MVTDRVVAAIEGRDGLAFEPIGEVNLKGFPAPTPLYLVRAALP
jgi:class 3 adenylate cyclase